MYYVDIMYYKNTSVYSPQTCQSGIHKCDRKGLHITKNNQI